MIRFIRLFKSANALEKAWAQTQIDAPDTVVLHVDEDTIEAALYGRAAARAAADVESQPATH